VLQGSSINDVTLKGEGGVHTSVTIREEGGGGRLSVVTSCRTPCDSQNAICWPVAGVCFLIVIAEVTTLQSTAG